MPHRVADFLRSSTETLSAAAISSLKSSIRPRSRSGSSSRRSRDHSHSPSPTRTPTDTRHCRTPSISDHGSDHFVPFIQMYEPTPVPANNSRSERRGRERRKKVKDRKERIKQQHDSSSSHTRRLSLPFGRSKERREDPRASLDWEIESPPIIFYGEPNASTGALVSGQLFLHVKDDALDVESFTASLRIHVRQKRPFASNCADCTDQYTDLKHWVFLTSGDGIPPTTLRRGRHAFPFSILLDGHLPITMDTPLVSISYDFRADAVFALNQNPSAPPPPPPLRFDRVFEVKRSLLRPDNPHQSIRIFPPTNIKAAASYNRIIHPAASGQNMTVRLDGLTTVIADGRRVEYWKLRKVTWKLQETIKTVAPACSKHMPRLAAGAADADAQSKGVVRTETRILGEKHLHTGWKSEYTGTDGRVDMEFEFGLSPAMLSASRPGYACDTRSRDGTAVSHALMVELVVSKECAPVSKPHLTSQTGTGRILRMHYNIKLTDFPGLGISWDNEAPPVYQDVPPSPPAYEHDDGVGPEYRDLEPLDAVLDSPEPTGRDWRWEESDLQSP